MPLVRMTFTPNHSPETRHAVADAVHAAMVATIDVPALDRFQILTVAEAGTELIYDRTFPDLERSDAFVIVEIQLAAGRSNDKKRALYAGIVERIAAATPVRPHDVMISLREVGRVDWSFGNGIAQYVPEG
jgi:phenylpyruvate tautomerase PptA (4-oxalocrotonate tautomerase family)